MEDVVCAAPAYLSRHGTPTTPGELSGHDCLLYLNPQRARRWTFRKAQRIQIVEVDGKLATNYHHALLKALLAGVGIAKLPQYFVADELKDGRLQRLLAGYQSDTLPIYLMHQDPLGQPPRLREFLKLAQEKFSV